MGTGKDYITSVLADKIIPLIRRPVEDIIYETLDRRQTPSRKDFHELRDRLNTINSKVTGATNGIRKLSERNENVENALDDLQDSMGSSTNPSQDKTSSQEVNSKVLEMADLITGMQATISVLNEKIEDQAKTISSLQSSGQQSKPASPAPSSEPVKLCKVSDCDDNVRARGFCAPHYAKWTRGTLSGFVEKEGAINGLSVSKKLAGKPYTLDGKNILVDGVVIAKI